MNGGHQITYHAAHVVPRRRGQTGPEGFRRGPPHVAGVAWGQAARELPGWARERYVQQTQTLMGTWMCWSECAVFDSECRCRCMRQAPAGIGMGSPENASCEAAENRSMEARTANRPDTAALQIDGLVFSLASSFPSQLRSVPATPHFLFHSLSFLPPFLPPPPSIPSINPTRPPPSTLRTLPLLSPSERLAERMLHRNSSSPLARTPSPSPSPYPNMSRKAPTQPKSTRQQYSGTLLRPPHSPRHIDCSPPQPAAHVG